MTCTISEIILNHKKRVNVLRPLIGCAFLSSTSVATQDDSFKKHQQSVDGVGPGDRESSCTSVSTTIAVNKATNIVPIKSQNTHKPITVTTHMKT